MNHPETNFSLSCQTAHVPVSSSPGAGTSLLTRRQQNATYLHQLELPSLPPLSQLLTEPNGNVAAANSRLIPSSKPTTAVMPSTEETTAAAAAAAMMHHQTTAQASVYFGDYSLGNISNTAMIPQTAAAAAAAAIPSSEATVTTTALSLAAQTSTAPATSSAELFVSNSAMMDQTFSSISLDTTGVYSSLAGPSAPGISTNDPNMAAAAAAAAAAMAAVSATNETAIKSEEERRKRHASESSTSSADKIYSFVAIPGTNQKKRPRRRYDEIERLYHCNWPGCTKSYGTLNHLNAHVSMQKHGPKRHPSEFKEMRKEWRRQKKEREAAKKANEEAMKQRQHEQEQQQHQQQYAAQQQQQHQRAAAAAAAAVVAVPPTHVPATMVGQPFQAHQLQQAYNQLHPSMTLGGYF